MACHPEKGGFSVFWRTGQINLPGACVRQNVRNDMFDRLDDLLIRFEEIMSELHEPTVTGNQERFRRLMKEQSDLTPIVNAYTEYKKCKQDIEDSLAMLEEEGDEEMRDMIKETLNEGKKRAEELEQELKGNAYPGRGIVIGRSADGKNAVIAYFIMGRSVNSRNRIFVTEGEGIRTQAFDPSKLSDPSLVIYAPVRVLKNDTIVTNGDQTDTVYQGLEAGQTFEQSLKTREYEPDGPNYTPRISGVVHCKENCFDYEMSILKSNDGDPSCCNRYTFSYDNPAPGQGRFIHTYMHDGDPLPSFLGEPKAVVLEGDIDAFAGMLWESLNEENKVSLFVRYIDLATGKYETRILNKNQAV